VKYIPEFRTRGSLVLGNGGLLGGYDITAKSIATIRTVSFLAKVIALFMFFILSFPVVYSYDKIIS
jgi:hypothetical protein